MNTKTKRENANLSQNDLLEKWIDSLKIRAMQTDINFQKMYAAHIADIERNIPIWMDMYYSEHKFGFSVSTRKQKEAICFVTGKISAYHTEWITKELSKFCEHELLETFLGAPINNVQDVLLLSGEVERCQNINPMFSLVGCHIDLAFPTETAALNLVGVIGNIFFGAATAVAGAVSDPDAIKKKFEKALADSCKKQYEDEQSYIKLNYAKKVAEVSDKIRETCETTDVQENTDLSTAEAIEALRYQLENGQNLMVCEDGSVMNSSDTMSTSVTANGGGFQPTNKFVTELQLDSVKFSAVTEKKLAAGQDSIIQILMYTDQFKDILEEAKEEVGKETKITSTSEVEIPSKAEIKIKLTSNDVSIEEDTDEFIWNGKYQKSFFAIEIPDNYAKKKISFKAYISMNGLPAARLFFTAGIDEEQRDIDIYRYNVHSAFMSYASADRNIVTAFKQGIEKARPDMDVFMDVENLRSGSDWEHKLYEAIDRRDVLFLCWSNNAKRSEWVEREWRHALDKKGLDSIEPLPIEKCTPPDELSSKHFNDMEVLIRAAFKNSSDDKKN